MDIFHCNRNTAVAMTQSQIVMRKVPECANSIADQTVTQFFHNILWKTKDCCIRLYFGAKFFQSTFRHNLDAMNFLSNQFWIFIKDSNQFKSFGFKRKMFNQSHTQVASTQKDDLASLVDAQNVSNFFIQSIYIVSVSLLSKTAKTV